MARVLCLGFSAFKSLSETLIVAVNEKLVLQMEEKSHPVKVGIEGCGLPRSESSLSEESNCPLSHQVMEQLWVSEVPKGVSLSSDTQDHMGIPLRCIRLLGSACAALKQQLFPGRSAWGPLSHHDSPLPKRDVSPYQIWSLQSKIYRRSTT